MSITDRIIMFFINKIHALLDSLGDIGGLETGLTYWAGFTELLDAAAYFLPLTCMMECLLTIVGIHLVFTNVYITNWVIKRVRGG